MNFEIKVDTTEEQNYFEIKIKVANSDNRSSGLF